MCSTLSETQTESKSPAGIQTEIKFDSSRSGWGSRIQHLGQLSRRRARRARVSLSSCPCRDLVFCSHRFRMRRNGL
ncbi:hypothetical protein AMECASPLE_012547 [Ameca splendens]|uniref:Uncharacterized protein n=1 Tax=Ameca splendens TaxID=208324 RepID=A0ABV0YZ14_9TELE